MGNYFFLKMNQEKFNLTWHTYADHLRDMLLEMMISDELTDVTLVSDDKKHFKAHKIVLCASSPVFKSIISDNSNPIIYLMGIQSEEVESILQFIYLGETSLFQDRMNDFLNVAKNLEIKEISKEMPQKEEFEFVKNEQEEIPSESDYKFFEEN